MSRYCERMRAIAAANERKYAPPPKKPDPKDGEPKSLYPTTLGKDSWGSCSTVDYGAFCHDDGEMRNVCSNYE